MPRLFWLGRVLRAQGEQQSAAIDGDSLDDQGGVAEFVTLIAKFSSLRQNELSVKCRNETRCFGVFRCRRPVCRLQTWRQT
jgi:hypothetical protein